jgi:pyruvate formate lyase activating enzyme
MIITAVNKFSLLDYPEKTCAILFTGGCNFRCGFCHNSSFVLPEKLKAIQSSFIPFSAVLNFLKTRQGLLEGVSICGGEPTLHSDLPERISEIKNLGFSIKLDTNGTNPEMIKKLLSQNLVDYYAMDIKYPFPLETLFGVSVDFEVLKKSITLIQEKAPDYEFRSTILPKYHTKDILHEMGKMIQGSKKWVLQRFRNGSVLNPEFERLEEFSLKDLDELREMLSSYGERVEVRK